MMMTRAQWGWTIERYWARWTAADPIMQHQGIVTGAVQVVPRGVANVKSTYFLEEQVEGQ